MTAEFSDSAILEDIAQRLSKDPERPDGIICFSDEQAIALMSALMRCGVTIPEEIAVTGCNNSALASLVSPSLTSVSIPIAELGRRSAAMLLSMIGGMKSFDLFYLLTNGDGNTQVVGLFIFRTAFEYRVFSRAVTMSVILTVLIGGLTFVVNFLASRKKEDY